MYKDVSNSSSRHRRGGGVVGRKVTMCFDAVDEACARVIHAVGKGLWWVLSKVPFMRRLADQVHVPDADLSEEDREDRSRYRRSSGWAIFLLIFSIVILPWLVELSFGADVYGMLKGSGQEAVERVPIVKAKRKKHVLNPSSAIIWEIPDLDEVFKEREKYPAPVDIPNRGDKFKRRGKYRGWPNGMETAKIQFIRLKHSGNGWNQQMDADASFLNECHKMTGLKIDPRPKTRTVSDLAKYRKGFEPPFMFMTGNGEIGLSSAEKKALREFTIENAGMLFVDNGGGSFDQSFRRLMREMYPDYPLVVISKHDPIFKYPFMFPHGAPRLFHHGNDVLGVRGPGGRWLVFYHPGGLNDAWQKKGSAGMRKSITKRAYQLGINVVAYSFIHKMAANAKAGK